MAEQATSFVQDGVDRFHEARERIDEEVQRLQKDLRVRRKNFEKQTRKQVKQLRSDFRRKPLGKRAEKLRADATKQIDSVLESVLGALRIASKQDLQRIDRKITQLNKKLKEIAEARKSNGPHAPTRL